MASVPSLSNNHQNDNSLAAFRVGEHDVKGRILIASRSIMAGERVITESPLVMWRQHQFTDTKLMTFCDKHKIEPSCLFGPMLMLRSPEHVRHKLATLYSGPPNSSLPSLNSVPLVDELGISSDDAITLERYLKIIQFNAFRIVAAGQRAGEGDDQAIYHMCSMFSHSCLPNCYYHSTPPHHDGQGGGQRIVHAIRNIKEGEELTVSYLDPALLLKPHQRRSVKLMRGKVCRITLSLSFPYYFVIDILSVCW
jgi:hypothetical protein